MSRIFDAIELELLWRRLISLVDEAAAALVRTSFSTLVRESYDFSCIVTDARGESLVQATESIPSFIGLAAGFLLWSLVITGASILLNSVMEEKSNKILGAFG
jgi:N-methylhydantoinase B/oxoprolinase/acetone carboxylase alpha subunit